MKDKEESILIMQDCLPKLHAKVYPASIYSDSYIKPVRRLQGLFTLKAFVARVKVKSVFLLTPAKDVLEAQVSSADLTINSSMEFKYMIKGFSLIYPIHSPELYNWQ